MGLTHQVGDGYDVRSLAVTYREGHTLSEHTHPWAQLIYARSGLMHVEAEGQIWFVPPTKAVWVPSQMPHRISFKGEVAMRTLYVSEQRADAIPRALQTLEVAPLLSHLIAHIHEIKMLDAKIAEHDHLVAVLIDLIQAAPGLDLVLLTPVDGRAARLAQHLRLFPADPSDLPTLSSQFGASLRTMQRCFKNETGLSLDAWRQKARLVWAFGQLASGDSVARAAHESGYTSTSAFIAAFKKQFGVTPGRMNAVAG